MNETPDTALYAIIGSTWDYMCHCNSFNSDTLIHGLLHGDLKSNGVVGLVSSKFVPQPDGSFLPQTSSGVYQLSADGIRVVPQAVSGFGGVAFGDLPASGLDHAYDSYQSIPGENWAWVYTCSDKYLAALTKGWLLGESGVNDINPRWVGVWRLDGKFYTYMNDSFGNPAEYV